MSNIKSILVGVIFLISTLFAQSNENNNLKDSWDSFVYPEVNVIVKNDNGKGQKGVDIVNSLLVNIDSVAKSICLGVCKEIYKNAAEVPAFTKLNYVLEYRDGLAFKAGNPPEITINFSTKYVESLANQSDAAAKYELEGVFWHELTHAYQHSPNNAGGYQSGDDYFGFIEGMADYVRIHAGYHNTRKPSKGHWNDGYTTTGFFFNWIVENIDPDFMYKFNKSANEINPWSFNKATTAILGKGIQILWNEYIHKLEGGNGEPVADFEINKQFIGKGNKIIITNQSYNNPESVEWFIDNQLHFVENNSFELFFTEAGTHIITLKVKNDIDSSSVSKEINVLDIEADIIDCTNKYGKITAEYDDSPEKEKISNLIDNNKATKFLTFNQSAWVQFQTTKMYRLVGYSLTSANDAPVRDPKEWVVKGSNDKVNWDILDERTNQDFSNRIQTNYFTTSASWGSYKYFRIEMKNNGKDSWGNYILQLSELELFGYLDQTTDIDIIKSEIPKTFSLEQNYPNPFNPETTISFSIKDPGKFNIAVYSLIGELVEVISDNYFEVGKYDVKYNASKLASGVYIYKLTGENVNISKKMILLK